MRGGGKQPGMSTHAGPEIGFEDIAIDLLEACLWTTISDYRLRDSSTAFAATTFHCESIFSSLSPLRRAFGRQLPEGR
jgi:hypothetical protein